MLWGAGAGEEPLADDIGRGEMSYQGLGQWDDDVIRNGWHEAPEEHYDYRFGLCPDPLGAMACFYVDVSQPECVGDLNGDGRTDQQDLGTLLGDYGCSADCVGDLDDDDDTDQVDLGILLADWMCGVGK
jgi:hypothetical protein